MNMHLLLACGALASAVTPSVAGTSERPNVVVILADDLGVGDPGCYNAASKIPTPNLDRLAREGVRLTDAHSPSAVCTPTRYGVLTGRYSWRGSLKSGVLDGKSGHLIEPGRATIASLLRERGYRTGGFGKWHLGLGPKRPTDYEVPLTPGPLDDGFERFFGVPASLDMPPYAFIVDRGLEEPASATVKGSKHRRQDGGGFWRAGAISPGFSFEQTLPRIVDEAVGWIDALAKEQGEAPFFVYLPLTAPHTPWVPTEQYQDRTEVGWYGDFVAQVDAEVGRVLETLDRLGVTKDTLIIVTSDNGSHWPDGDVTRWEHDANLGYRGQKADIWEGGHRVPFLARWPGRIPAGSVRDDLACLTDLFATIAAATGDEALAGGAAEDSFDLLPALLGEDLERPARDHVIHHSLHGHFALREGNWKLIPRLGSGGFTSPREQEPEPDGPAGQLFDLAEDPAETTNLWSERPELVARLQARLAALKEAGGSR